MVWTVVALDETPTLTDHIRLHFWQDDGPPPPDLPKGWVPLASARWTAA
jgi:hypothetical protein